MPPPLAVGVVLRKMRRNIRFLRTTKSMYLEGLRVRVRVTISSVPVESGRMPAFGQSRSPFSFNFLTVVLCERRTISNSELLRLRLKPGGRWCGSSLEGLRKNATGIFDGRLCVKNVNDDTAENT